MWNAARNALPRVPFVNTASMAGFLSDTGFGAYTASKFAVVGISEALSTELEPQGIGVSILCPGWVATRISESRRNWPNEYGVPPPRGPLRTICRARSQRDGAERRCGVGPGRASEQRALYLYSSGNAAVAREVLRPDWRTWTPNPMASSVKIEETRPPLVADFTK